MLIDEAITDTQSTFDRVALAYDAFVMPADFDRSVYEAIIFSVATQANHSNLAQNLVRALHQTPTELLADSDFLNWYARYGLSSVPQSKNGGFVSRWNTDVPKNNRFAPILEYIDREFDSPTGFVKQFLESPRPYRRFLDSKKGPRYIRAKTASMIYLCFGGDIDLLTIDRHVRDEAIRLGIGNDEDHGPLTRVKGKAAGQSDRKQLTIKQYEELEERLVEGARSSTLNVFPDYRLGQEKPHTGLLTTRFYLPGWRGTKQTYQFIDPLNPLQEVVSPHLGKGPTVYPSILPQDQWMRRGEKKKVVIPVTGSLF